MATFNFLDHVKKDRIVKEMEREMENLKEINLNSYLNSLINFIKVRVDIPDSNNDIEQVLHNRFFQSFDTLSNTTQEVNQVRIAVEVLRSYRDDQQKVPEYLEAAYRLLLNGLGTSYDEMRLITEENSEHLAQRLGIKAEQLIRNKG